MAVLPLYGGNGKLAVRPELSARGGEVSVKIVIECSTTRECRLFANMLNQGALVAWVATESANAPSERTGKPTRVGSRRGEFKPSSVAIELTPTEERNWGDALPITRVKVAAAGD